MVSLAAGSLLAPWEDDDISLPHRLELTRERLGDRDYFNPRRYWFRRSRRPALGPRDGRGPQPVALPQARLAGRRRLPGRDRLARRGDGRAAWPAIPRVCCRVDEEPLPVPDWYYLYRWGASPCHLSGQPDMQGLYDSLGTAPAAPGRFVLQPHWREDYTALVAAHAGAMASSTGSRRPRRAADGDSAARPPRCRLRHHLQAGGGLSRRVGRVEDWGCGTAYFKRFVPADCYRGIDHDPSACRRPDRRPGRLHIDNRRHLHAARARARPAAGEASCGTPWRRSAAAWSWWSPHAFVRATEDHHRAKGPARGRRSAEIRFCRGDLVRELRGCPVPARRECRRPTRRSAASTSSTSARTVRHERVPRRVPALLNRRRPGRAASAMTRVHPDLAAAYQQACTTVSDIYLHLPTLYRYASCCRHVTEFGTRTGVSTLALLRAVPERLVAYDLDRYPEVDHLEELARLQERRLLVPPGRHAPRRPGADGPAIHRHVPRRASSIEAELAASGAKVRRYLIFHDTETYGEHRRRTAAKGIWSAIAAFVRRRARPGACWTTVPQNNGLTVLWRTT